MGECKFKLMIKRTKNREDVKKNNKENFYYHLENGVFTSSQALKLLGDRETLAAEKECRGTDLIWGSLLGDAHCNERGCITFQHSVIATPYLFWKWELLRKGGLLAEKSKPTLLCQQHKRIGRWYSSLRFHTRTLFYQERQLFYRATGGRGVVKTFPPLEGNKSRFTPGALAVWYMDDGGRGGNSARGCVIDVSCWGPLGEARIKETLESVYQLKTTFHRSGKKVKLFIPQASSERFRDLVAPYILPSMYYKIAHLF